MVRLPGRGTHLSAKAAACAQLNRATNGLQTPLVKTPFTRLLDPAGAVQVTQEAGHMVKKALPRIAGLYRGVFGAASGAGIAIGAYFAFYGAATNVLVRNTEMKPASIAFVSGAVAAAGGSIVKVPLAVCIRSVQAGVYPNVIKAASEISTAAGEPHLISPSHLSFFRLASSALLCTGVLLGSRTPIAQLSVQSLQ